jgi:hypothetical protein
LGVRQNGGAYLIRQARELAFTTIVLVLVSQHLPLFVIFTKSGIDKLEAFFVHAKTFLDDSSGLYSFSTVFMLE